MASRLNSPGWASYFGKWMSPSSNSTGSVRDEAGVVDGLGERAEVALDFGGRMEVVVPFSELFRVAWRSMVRVRIDERMS